MDFRTIGGASALILLLAACAGTGETSSRPTAAAEEPVKAAMATQSKETESDDDLICKEVVKTGTRFSETICAPRHAWEKSEAHGQKATEDIQRRPVYQDAQSPPGGG